MPPLEAWQKVLVTADFLTETHGTRSCTSCHGGDSRASGKSEAHTGMVPDPSSGEAPACATCHTAIVDNHAASLHGMQGGYLTILAQREGGVTISSAMREMFDRHCAECHTSCGQCHLSRPSSVGGGFLDGHLMVRKPRQTENCTACHGSRVGDEFRGVNPGQPSDTHYFRGMDCLDCHDGDEVHGDGSAPEHRYDVSNGPACADCHPGVGGAGDNEQHVIHAATVACQVCHSASYKNCYSCHVGLEARGLQFPSRIDFRIGRNPVVNSRHPWTWVLVRHAPVAPGSFTDWGVSLSAYDSAPTWHLATPHNIRRNTPQNASCDACHGQAGLFLTPAYVDSLVSEGIVFPTEITANADVMVTTLPEGERSFQP